MLPAESTPWATAWVSLYVALVWDVLKLAARGHEIVGILRLFGFNVFRNTYKPLLAPSIVEFWNRYYYYFKELLVEFFFFPTYVRRFRRSPRLRIFAATLAAAGFGNLYYHVLQHDAFMLTLEWAAIGSWLLSRGFYCLLLSVGIYVSMRREQGRRGTTAAAPVPVLTQVRRVAGVWTFFALISIWSDDNVAGFGQRVSFFLALFGVR
jgi:D-alanyl-lipoteichoic acid acyltransferase DltB (MBOAT superfamily)